MWFAEKYKINLKNAQSQLNINLRRDFSLQDWARAPPNQFMCGQFKTPSDDVTRSKLSSSWSRVCNSSNNNSNSSCRRRRAIWRFQHPQKNIFGSTNSILTKIKSPKTFLGQKKQKGFFDWKKDFSNRWIIFWNSSSDFVNWYLQLILITLKHIASEIL